MAEAGYFPVEELLTLRKLGSRLQVTPSGPGSGTGVDFGALGAAGPSHGIAYAHRLDGKNSRTWCVTSDGEHDEGLHWEACWPLASTASRT